MTQVSKYPLNKKVAERIMEIFIKTLINVTNKVEAEQLISDFLTPTEKIMLSKRLAIALLLENNYDYRAIGDILKVSSGTIAQINNARSKNSTGYRKFIRKIKKDEQINAVLLKTLSEIVALPASIRSSTSVWKSLDRKLKTKISNSSKPF